MTQAELYTALKSLGLPVAYSHFDTAPSIPFLVYYFGSSNDFYADNINFADGSMFTVELYTAKKDLASEKLVEDKFKELSIAYTKLEEWIETEKLYQIAYEIQI